MGGSGAVSAPSIQPKSSIVKSPRCFASVLGGYATSTDASGTTTYTYGLQRISEDQIVNGGWTPSFYGYDGGGNVRQLTNSAGALTDTYEYDAFGNKINSTGTSPNNYLYRGEQYDGDLGLYYLRARYYNPATGRFMSRDPLDGNTTDPRTLRKYLYVGGDPVNGIDPRGREEQVEDTSLTARIAKVPFTVSCLIHDALVGFLFGWDSAKFGIVGFGCAVLGTLGY